MREEAKSNSEMTWAMEERMWKFGAASPNEWMLKYADHTMKGIADSVTCQGDSVQRGCDCW